MWIREALLDSPRGAWLGILLGWTRTALFALAAVGVGATLDAVLGGSVWWIPAMWATFGILLGALCGGLTEAIPGRIQAEEELNWRQRMLRRAIQGPARQGATRATHPGTPAAKFGTSVAHSSQPAVRPDKQAARSSRPAHPGHPHGRPGGASGEGALVDAATTGVEKTANYRASFLGPTLASFTAPLFVLIVWAVSIDVLTALILFVFVALVPVVIVYVGKWLRKPNHEYRRKESAAANQYLEMLEGIGTMKVLGAAPAARDRFAESARSAMRELGSLLGRNQLMIIVNDGVFGLLMSGVAIVLVLAGLASGALTAGEAFAGLLLTVLLNEPIDRVGRTFYVGLAGRARRDQLEELVAGIPARAELAAAIVPHALHQDAQETSRGPVGIELRGVSVEIRGKQILEEVNLRIPAGARVALVGPSGAGKSTLLRAIAGLTEAQPGATMSGEILINGRPATASHLRSLVTTVAQNPGILSTTVADNLRLVAADATDEELSEVLDRAHLREEVEAMPEQLSTQVGDRGTFLSGGQRRRVAIARAFLRERPVLLLDEPTADLDRRTEALVRESLASMSEGRTIVQIAHRLESTLDADFVAVVGGGRLIAKGTPDELRARGGYYAAALQHHAVIDDADRNESDDTTSNTENNEGGTR